MMILWVPARLLTPDDAGCLILPLLKVGCVSRMRLGRGGVSGCMVVHGWYWGLGVYTGGRLGRLEFSWTAAALVGILPRPWVYFSLGRCASLR